MSEVIQSGRHPDADQLSAFVEQALPAHEREATLTHLAVCAECRAVVALSVPAEQLAKPAEKPARQAWFQGWNLAWPAAAVVAALVLVLVFVYHATVRRSGQGGHEEMAVAPPPAPIAPRPVPQKQSSAPAARRLQQAPASSVRQALQSDAANLKSFNHPLAAAPSAPRIQPATGGMGAGSTSFIPKDLLQQPPTLAESRAPQAPPPAAKAQNKARAPAAITMNALAAKPSTDQIHGAFGEAASGVIANGSSNRAILHLRSPIHPLPSGLPVLSMAEHGRQTLAIDSAHALFLSDDGGAHWRAVAVPWKARAVAVSLVSSSTRNAEQTGSGFGEAFGFDSRIIGGPIKKLETAVGTASVTGTVTDQTGAAIPGASVVVSRAADHVSQTAITDRNGRYSVTGLAQGTYDVKASATGFEIAQVARVKVSPSRENVANLKLSVGTATETVTVAPDSMAGKIPLQTQGQPTKPAPAVPSSMPATIAAPPLFEVTTEDGARWTSADGVTWKRE